MKTAGVVGGIGPESTLEYYRLMVALYRERRPDGSYPPILINSINMTRMLALIGVNQLAEVTEYLLNEVNKLAAAGADFGLLASNTPHIVFDRLQNRSPIPLISIVEAACDAAQSMGLKIVGLFGTRFTMQGRFYPDVFTRQGIRIVAPPGEDQDFIHGKYMGELVQGLYKDETRQRLLSIVDGLKQREGIEGLILGGTELPLILKDKTYHGIPFLDTTRIHVERVISEILA